ncbi:olfactory receptor 2AP1-like [Hemicordylus capensis]|uniref:olfactory receptor 2AP1-like n=1 Tax=Hemicordylus capensis TaxID=884348 RepID=UPI00230251CF|nr:olfactory receptor 2AP1-like [Hemicordylus capensis]
MELKDYGNKSTVTRIILMGFGDLQHLQIPLFLFFLAVYIVTLLGNLILIVLVVTDQHLHTPMYFFLGNLSSLEICYSSTIVPRLLNTLVTDDETVSLSSCLVQYFFFAFLLATESHLLSVMSYDRYVAICKPLHYATLMSSSIRIRLATIAWINGLTTSVILQFFISQLVFCGPNEIDHYLCDIDPLIKLSCSDTSQVELATVILGFIFTMPPLFLTLASYTSILSTIFRIPSSTGRRKAFSTCSSHLIMVSSFYLSMMIVYMLPKNEDMRRINKSLSLLYTVLPPLVNPFIYSLRNQDVKEVLFRKLVTFSTIQIFPAKVCSVRQK